MTLVISVPIPVPIPIPVAMPKFTNGLKKHRSKFKINEIAYSKSYNLEQCMTIAKISLRCKLSIIFIFICQSDLSSKIS